MEKKTYYITTPIYYPSGTWHLGTCYTTVVCDALARFKKMDGFDTFYLTGTDEHGQKIEKVAEDAHKEIHAFLDERIDTLKKLWSVLGIKYDKFIRTTDSYHKEAVKKIFTKLYEKGDIYKSHYEGHYCAHCESFWTESQLKAGKCPDCDRETTIQKEECYFFKLSQYGDRITKLIKENPDFLQPPSRQNEMIKNFLLPGLQDLCVSRTSFKWGIPVEFDKDHVIYVWIDALTNYLTALGYASDDETLFKKYWPADIHMMGKEIVRFHAIIWPAILMALDLPLPKRVYGHGWLLFGDEKMSKSKGNIIDPFELCARYGVDSVRYYLLRDISFGNDGLYTLEAFLRRRNADLCNDLGNLLSRTLMMINKYFNGILPEPVEVGEFDSDLIDKISELYPKVRDMMDNLMVSEALSEIFKVVSRANKYIDETTPWILARDSANKQRLGTVLYNLAEALRIVGILLKPFLIDAPNVILDALSVENPSSFEGTIKFGGLKPGTNIKVTNKLFDRIDIETELLNVEVNNSMNNQTIDNSINNQPNETVQVLQEKAPAFEKKPLIEYAEFAKMDLRVGIIKNAEAVKKSNKLLKLTVDIGIETRTIVSGIAKYYAPEQLIGKRVCAIINLAPVKLCGVESEGMLLCSSNVAGDVILLNPGEQMNGGDLIS
ncbi:MAG: methionine--tRNA ligase [Christensenellaceae bacterium]|nr:methionine--tRNA ligase [Christensenellaceae bacterium]